MNVRSLPEFLTFCIILLAAVAPYCVSGASCFNAVEFLSLVAVQSALDR